MPKIVEIKTMALFSQTESDLSELSANNNMRFGTHTRYDLASGVPGLIIGEQLYDQRSTWLQL